MRIDSGDIGNISTEMHTVLSTIFSVDIRKLKYSGLPGKWLLI